MAQIKKKKIPCRWLDYDFVGPDVSVASHVQPLEPTGGVYYISWGQV
jgi:hypothetical protein